MATSTRLRSSLRGLSTLAANDLSALWRHLEQATDAEQALRDVLPTLIDTYGAAASTLAADWYDDLRDKHDVRGGFRAVPAQIADSGAQSLVGWALDTATDVPAFTSLILGGTQRRIVNHARLTVMDSSVADPGSRGWQREGTGQCEFCQMLIGRGAVYSEASADFQSHDHCGCVAVPAF